jgi:tRNA(Ile)-lysidine synthase
VNEFSAVALSRELVDRLVMTPPTHLRVAYSGGVDSHVLLYALAELRRSVSLSVSAIHVDHGLSSNSAEWARHCQRVCADLEIDCVVERIVVSTVKGDGVEAAARRARYECFARRLGALDVLLTAHHQDDQAETLMLQLLRGCGVHGLSGMAELAEMGQGRLARPLLGFSRASLERYAVRHGLQWIEDPSNSNLHIGRNLLRRRVFPQLVPRWPEFSKNLARSTRHAARARAILDEVAQDDLRECASKTAPDLNISILTRLSTARQENLLRFWIRRLDLPVPSTIQLAELLRQVRHPSRSGQARITWPGAEARRYRDQLCVMSRAAAGQSRPENANWRSPWNFSDPLYVPAAQSWLYAHSALGAGLACARVSGQSIEVRMRRGGETCRLPRRPTRSLKKILQEEGVPPWDRVRLPLVFVNGELAAIADRWICEPYAAVPDEPGWVLTLKNQPDAE